MRRISGDAVTPAVHDDGAGSPVPLLDAPAPVNELLLELPA